MRTSSAFERIKNLDRFSPGGSITMSTKSRSSTYLELWFGVLLLGTMLILNGCGSNTFFPPPLQVYATNGNAVSV